MEFQLFKEASETEDCVAVKGNTLQLQYNIYFDWNYCDAKKEKYVGIDWT